MKEFISKIGAYFADHHKRLAACLTMLFTLLAASALTTALIHQFKTGHTGLMISCYALFGISVICLLINIFLHKFLPKWMGTVMCFICAIIATLSAGAYFSSAVFNLSFLFWIPPATIAILLFMDFVPAVIGGAAMVVCSLIYTFGLPHNIEGFDWGFRALFAAVLVTSYILGTLSAAASNRISAAEEEYRKKLQELAFFDSLTTLHNHLYYDQYVEKTEHDAILPLKIGVLFIDVDNLKHINDTYGHAAGNEAIVAVANALKSVNAQETIRYAGDEFIIVEPGLEHDALNDIAERVLVAVDASKLKTAPDWKLSVSLGGFCGVIKGEGDIHNFVKEADRQLYVSKRGGKHKITIIE